MSTHNPNGIVKWVVESSQIFTRTVRRQIGEGVNRLTSLPHWRRLCFLSTVLVVLLLLVVYWQTEDIQAANATKSDTKTVVEKPAADKPEPSPPKKSLVIAAPDKTKSAPKKEYPFTAEEQKIFSLLEQYGKMMEKKGQDDPEVKLLKNKLYDADKALQEKMKSAVDIRMDTLPAAPKEGTSAQDKSKTPQPIKPITPQVTKPATPPKVTDPKEVKPPKTTAKPPTKTTPPEPNKPPTKAASQSPPQEKSTPTKPEIAKPTVVESKTATSPVTPVVKPTVVQPGATKPPKTIMVMRPKPSPTATPSKATKAPTAKPPTAKPPTTKPPTTKPPTNSPSSKVQSKTASSKAVTPPASKPASPAAPTPSAKPEATATIIKADPNSAEPSPDDIVLLKIKDNQLDVQFLIDLVAKELQLNIIYDPGQPLTGKVYIQQRGKIYRKDLQPLLGMILGLQGYSMIREESFIRIFKRDPNVLKKSKPRIIIGQEMPEILPGETLLTQIIEVQHVKVAEVQKFLLNFLSDATAIKTIAGTNYLIITEYVNRLPRILEMVSLIDRPGPPRKLKPITIQHIPVRDARTHVEALFKALAAQGASTLATTTSTPTPTKPKTAAEIRAQRIRELAEKRKAATSGSTAAAIPQGPTLYTYDLTSQLLVIGTEAQIKQVEDLLVLLDVEPPGPEIKLETIQVKHVTASGASTKVKALLDSLEQKITTAGPTAPTVKKPPTSSRTPPRPPTTRPPTPQTITAAAKGPVFHLDERTNRIFLVGYEEQIQQAKELLSLIDVVAGPEIKLEVLNVEYVEPDAVATQIQSLIKALNENTAAPESTTSRTVTPTSTRTKTPTPTSSRTRTTPSTSQQMLYDQSQKGPAIFVDKRTTRMFVVGSEDQIGQVKELLALLDVEAGKPIRLEILRVQNVEASEIASEIESIIKALNESSAPGVDSFQQSAPIPTATGSRSSSTATRTTPRPPTTTTRSRSTLALATEQGPALFIDDRNNRLLVVGNDEQIEQVKEILALLDVVEGPEIKIAVLRVQYVEAADVGPEIEELLDALYEKGAGTITPTSSSRFSPALATPPRPGGTPAKPTTPGRQPSRNRTGEMEKKRGPAIFVDERTNRLLIVGSDEQIDQVKDLLALLDVLEGPEIKLVAVRLQYVLAVDVADQVRDLLDALYESGAYMPGVHRPGSDLMPTSSKPSSRTTPTPTTPRSRTTPTTQPKTTSPSRSKESGKAGPIIVIDERTNRLLVVGSEEQIEQFRSILALLDVKEGPEIRLASFEIEHVIADDIAGQLEELLNAFNEQGGKATRATTSSAVPTTSVTPVVQPASTGPSGGRTTPSTTRPGQESSTKKAEELGPFILVDSRTNRLLIVGSDEQIDQFQELLKVLDVPPSEYYRLVLKIYQPQYVEAAEVQRIMDALGITETGEQAPRDQARAGGTNGVRPGSARSTPASTPSGTGTVGGLFSRGPGEGMLLPGQEEPEVRMAIQETTNKIYILATEYQHRDISEIMKQVDVEPDEDMGAIQI